MRGIVHVYIYCELNTVKYPALDYMTVNVSTVIKINKYELLSYTDSWGRYVLPPPYLHVVKDRSQE